MKKINHGDFVWVLIDPFSNEIQKEKAIADLEKAFEGKEINITELFQELSYWAGTCFEDDFDNYDTFFEKYGDIIEKYVSGADFVNAVIATQSFKFIAYILFKKSIYWNYDDIEAPEACLSEDISSFEKITNKLEKALDEMVSQLINEGNITSLLEFAHENFYDLKSYLLLDKSIYNSIKKLIDFVISMGDAKVICEFASYETLLDKYPYLLDALLNTHNLKYIYCFVRQFPIKDSHGLNYNLSKENMSKLVTSVIETNIPAYMYLVAVKIKNIPDEVMKRLIATIVVSNDKKYIDYLLMHLSKKGVSKEVKDFITSLGISIDLETKFNYDSTLADELKDALLKDNYELLYKHGIYSYEDRAYKLANVWAGL